MIRLVLSEVIEAIGGQTLRVPPARSVTGVSIDSRTLKPDQLFIAITGPRFDGHDFVLDALAAGATAAVVQRERAPELEAAGTARDVSDLGGRLIRVPDPVQALGALAAFHRNQARATVIAVVGSNGKTTTKAMIHHLLGLQLTGHASPRSFNNLYGVPLTLLSTEARDDYLVVEIGTNAPGEVAALARLAQPDMVVLTSIGEEHLEGLGDLHGVAEEECSILSHLRPGGFAAVNIDSPLVRGRVEGAPVRVATFGYAPEADFRVADVKHVRKQLHFAINGRFRYHLPFPGAHNATNAAGAIMIARRFGLEHEQLAPRLASFSAPPMRTELLERGGVTILNDAYNANPQSVLAAIETLLNLPCQGKRVLVLGEMCELGRHTRREHERIARRIAESGVDVALLVGPAGALMRDALGDGQLFGPRLEYPADVAAAGRRLARLVATGDCVLLKGSRAVGLEQVLEHLCGGCETTPI